MLFSRSSPTISGLTLIPLRNSELLFSLLVRKRLLLIRTSYVTRTRGFLGNQRDTTFSADISEAFLIHVSTLIYDRRAIMRVCSTARRRRAFSQRCVRRRERAMREHVPLIPTEPERYTRSRLFRPAGLRWCWFRKPAAVLFSNAQRPEQPTG
jgi:hypothetical protein